MKEVISHFNGFVNNLLIKREKSCLCHFCLSFILKYKGEGTLTQSVHANPLGAVSRMSTPSDEDRRGSRGGIGAESRTHYLRPSWHRQQQLEVPDSSEAGEHLIHSLP